MKMYCSLCGHELDEDPKSPWLNCGGDCRRCLAEAGDPDCEESMREIGYPYKPAEWEDPPC